MELCAAPVALPAHTTPVSSASGRKIKLVGPPAYSHANPTQWQGKCITLESSGHRKAATDAEYILLVTDWLIPSQHKNKTLLVVDCQFGFEFSMRCKKWWKVNEFVGR